jgi:hypothetical protein
MSDAEQPQKAVLKSEKGDVLTFRFNPAELVISKSNNWTGPPKKGKNAPNLEFQEGQSGTFSFTAVFDTTHDGSDVTTQTNMLLTFMRTDPELKGSDRNSNKARPPWVKFSWGSVHSFRAVVERATITFTYFSQTGTALRAKVDVGLKQYGDEEDRPRQNPTSGTRNPERAHHVRAGETLDRIAAVHYADPSRWRLLAEANGIDDPFSVPPGMDLLVPELEVVRRGR